MKSVMIVFLILFATFPVMAEVVPYLWEPGQTQAPLLIFAGDGETAQEAAAKYLESVRSDSDLAKAFDGQLSNWTNWKLSGFRPVDRVNLLNVGVLIANSASDLASDSPRVSRFRNIFGKNNNQTIVLPLGIYSGRTADFQSQMQTWISKNVPLLVAMGGEDVDPSLYAQKRTFSGKTFLARDLFESRLIKKYLEAEIGFLLSICRGHQLTSVALGYELLQDISRLVPDALSHQNDEHLISIRKTSSSILFRLFGQHQIKVNSLHHQAVSFRPGGPLEIAAVGSDGIIEALEMKNGHGLFLQFHPELMPDKIGNSIMTEVVQSQRRFSPKACGRLHAH